MFSGLEQPIPRFFPDEVLSELTADRASVSFAVTEIPCSVSHSSPEPFCEDDVDDSDDVGAEELPSDAPFSLYEEEPITIPSSAERSAADG